MALAGRSGTMLLFPTFALLIVFSSAESYARIKPSKVDNRFSKGYEFTDLFNTCINVNSINYLETRLVRMCNPPNVPLGIPVLGRYEGYRYSLLLMGKPKRMFTIKIGKESAHNMYDENIALNFTLYPDQCQIYTITNLGDGVANSRIIYKLYDHLRPKCDERALWVQQQQNHAVSQWISDETLMKALRAILISTLKMQPVKGLDVIIKSFWPKSGPSLWDKIEREIEKNIKVADMFRVNETLKQRLNVYREKLEDLQSAMAIGNSHVEKLVMSISSQFVGEQNYVMFKNEVLLSYHTLSFFTTSISLFINFHKFALTSADKYNFHADSVKMLKSRRDRLVEHAHHYIMKTYDANMERAFQTCDLSSNFYNCIVDVHNHVTQNGIQLLPALRSMSDYKTNDTRVFEPMLYSHSFGVPTTELLKSVMFHPMHEFPLLTPPFANQDCERYSKDERCFERLNATRVYITYADDKNRLAQMWFSFDETHPTALLPSGIKWDSFMLPDDVVITKIIVGGDGQIGDMDYIQFYLSDGESNTFGYIDYNKPNKAPKKVTFEMEGHNIAQAFILNDDIQRLDNAKNRAKTIAVSYRMNRNVDNSIL